MNKRIIISDQVLHVKHCEDFWLLSEAIAIDIAHLDRYDQWLCVIENHRYQSDIGVLICLAALLNKKIWFKSTNLLTAKRWNQMCTYYRKRLLYDP